MLGSPGNASLNFVLRDRETVFSFDFFESNTGMNRVGDDEFRLSWRKEKFFSETQERDVPFYPNAGSSRVSGGMDPMAAGQTPSWIKSAKEQLNAGLVSGPLGIFIPVFWLVQSLKFLKKYFL